MNRRQHLLAGSVFGRACQTEDTSKLSGSHDDVGCPVPFVCIHPYSLGSQTQALLTFPKRLLGPPAFGNVLNGALEPHDTPGSITSSFATRDEPSGGAIGTDHLQFEFVWHSGEECFFDRITQPLP